MVLPVGVLHLRCHFGLDTLRIADEADEVIGVDFSPKAIALARDLAFELGSSARFVESDVYALGDVLHEQFDIVFASYGVLHWLPSLACPTKQSAAYRAHALQPWRR